MMERFSAWSLHTLISMTVLCTMIDAYPPSTRGQKEKFAIATASISFASSAIVTFSHLIRPLRRFFVDTILEMLLAVMPLSLWVFTAILIQNPMNSISSTINQDTGAEDILYANLYFSGWLILFSNAWLISTVFRDHNEFHKDISGWMLLLTSSTVLMGMSITLRSEICDLDAGMACIRTIFAIILGATGIVASLVAMMLIACGYMKTGIKLVIGFICSGGYVAGVILLTSSAGPASNVGTIYFTAWSGATLSCLLFISALQEAFFANDIEEQGPGDAGAKDDAAPQATM